MEKLYHLAKRFKAYQFDGDLKNSDGYYCPEWVQQAFERDELKAYITADGGIDVFKLKETFYHDNPEKAGKKLKLDHYYIKTKNGREYYITNPPEDFINFCKNS